MKNYLHGCQLKVPINLLREARTLGASPRGFFE